MKKIFLSIFITTLLSCLSFANEMANYQALIQSNPELLQKLQNSTNNKTSTTVEKKVQITNDIEQIKQADEKVATENIQTTTNEIKTIFDYQTREEILKSKKPAKLIKISDKRFGEDFLRNKNNLNQDNFIVPDDYLVSNGDYFSVSLYGASNFTNNYKVGNDGTIFLDKIGPVKILGKSYSEARAIIEDKLTSSFSESKVHIQLNSNSSIQVTITGETFAPGIYNLPAFTTISHAIIAAQGVKKSGTLREILLKRDNKIISRLDIYDLVRYGDKKDDKLLQNGDVVVVTPIRTQIKLNGEAKNIGLFELKDGESLEKLLEYAGGFTTYSDKDNIKVQTIKRDQSINSIDLKFNDSKKHKLRDGDIVTIYPMSNKNILGVELLGSIENPGMYSLNDKSLHKFLKSFIAGKALKEVFLDNAELSYAIIKRVDADLQESIIGFNPLEVIEAKGDLELEDDDKIMFFDKLGINENRYVQVNGEIVKKEGKVQYFNGMTINDLINITIFKSEQLLDDEGKICKKDIKNDENKLQSEKKCLRIPMNLDRDNIKLTRVENGYLTNSVINASLNPDFKLNEFDQIEFIDFQKTNDQKFIYINGEVNLPGRYVYSESMELNNLIELAGNYTKKAYKSKVEIVRYKIVDEVRTSEVLKVDLNNNNNNNNIKLHPYDEVTVFKIPKWNDKKRVTISGNVYFPGTYVINEGEKLSSLLERVGGFTSEAFVEGAMFTRESLKEIQTQHMKRSISNLKKEAAYLSTEPEQAGKANINSAELLNLVNSLSEDIEKNAPLGRLTIRLPKDLTEFKDSKYDVTLKDSDNIFIPGYNDTVTVLGEVLSPTSFVYEDSISLSNAIEKAGGLSSSADEDSIYLIHANGEAEISSMGLLFSSSDIRPGDTVIVPVKLDRFSGMRFVKDISQIFYQLALTVAAANAVGAF